MNLCPFQQSNHLIALNTTCIHSAVRSPLGPTITITIKLVLLSSDPANQIQVLDLQCYPMGMDAGQIGILEQNHSISFEGFLKRQKSICCPAQICPSEVLADLSYQALKRKFAQQKFSRLLIISDLL